MVWVRSEIMPVCCMLDGAVACHILVGAVGWQFICAGWARTYFLRNAFACTLFDNSLQSIKHWAGFADQWPDCPRALPANYPLMKASTRAVTGLLARTSECIDMIDRSVID